MKWSLHCVVFIDCRLWEWGDPPLFWRKNTHMILFCIFKFEAHLLAFIRSIAAICFLKKKTTLTKISIFVQPYNLQMCMHFWGNSDSEWILFEWLDETGSKFWFQNTCEKVKSNFWNRNKNKIKKVPFFLETPCIYIYIYIYSSERPDVTLWFHINQSCRVHILMDVNGRLHKYAPQINGL